MRIMVFSALLCLFSICCRGEGVEADNVMIDKACRQCDIAAAVYVVNQQIADKDLMIFADHDQQPGEKKIDDFTVRTVVDSGIRKNGRSAPQTFTYIRAHNWLVMKYAIGQYLEGNRLLGFYLINALCTIAPEGQIRAGTGKHFFSELKPPKIDKSGAYKNSMKWIASQFAHDFDSCDKYDRVGGSSASHDIVRQQALQENIMVFATAATAKNEDMGFADFNIRIVADQEIINKNQLNYGSYNQRHNALVLSYAAFQYVNGNRAFGLLLLNILASVDPNLQVGVGDDAQLSFAEIVQAIDQGDASIEKKMAYCATQWQTVMGDWSKQPSAKIEPNGKNAEERPRK